MTELRDQLATMRADQLTKLNEVLTLQQKLSEGDLAQKFLA